MSLRGCGVKLPGGRAVVLVEAYDDVLVPALVGVGMVGAPVAAAAVLSCCRCHDDRSRHRSERSGAEGLELVRGGIQACAVATDPGVPGQDRANPLRFTILAQRELMRTTVVGCREIEGQCRCHPPPEDQSLQQAVGGEPVGPVYAGCGDLADGVQTRYIGRPVAVGSNAAAQEVFGRCDRDLLGQQVDADACSGGQHGREPPPEHVRRDICRIQPDMV